MLSQVLGTGGADASELRRPSDPAGNLSEGC